MWLDLMIGIAKWADVMDVIISLLLSYCLKIGHGEMA